MFGGKKQSVTRSLVGSTSSDDERNVEGDDDERNVGDPLMSGARDRLQNEQDHCDLLEKDGQTISQVPEGHTGPQFGGALPYMLIAWVVEKGSVWGGSPNWQSQTRRVWQKGDLRGGSF